MTANPAESKCESKTLAFEEESSLDRKVMAATGLLLISFETQFFPTKWYKCQKKKTLGKYSVFFGKSFKMRTNSLNKC